MAKSYLSTHPHVRRIVYGVVALAAVAAIGAMFDFDRVAGWIEGGSRSAGIDLTTPAK